MSDSPAFGFGKFVPGFDFLQNLAGSAMKGASSSIPQLPNLGNWVAPTLSVEELDKRIDELKAVQFWLDQNAMALKATIQALEVQKMTLATLKGMNFNMGDIANAFKLKATETVASTVQKAAEKVAEVAAPAPSPAPAASQAETKSGDKPAEGGLIDPMQWWGALTQQFQHIASNAMKEAAKQTAFDATKNMAAGLAKEALKTATGMAQAATKTAAPAAKKTKAPAKKAAAKKAVKKTS